MYASRQQVDIGRIQHKSRNTLNMRNFRYILNTSTDAIIWIDDPIYVQVLKANNVKLLKNLKLFLQLGIDKCIPMLLFNERIIK